MTATTAAATPATAIPRRWLAILLAGVLLLAVGAALGFSAVRGAFTAPILSTPGAVSEHAHAGEYLLYAQSGTQHGALGLSTSDTYQPQLRASAFMLTEDGTTLELAAYDSRVSQTEQRGSRVFLAVASVHVPRAGRLTLTVGDDEGAVILGPSLGGTVGRALPGAGVGLLGVLLVVVALVVRTRAVAKVRPQWRLGPTGYAYQPPGWTPPKDWTPPVTAPWPPPSLPSTYQPAAGPTREPPPG